MQGSNLPQQPLNDQNEQFYALIRALPIGVLLLNQEAEVLVSNQAAQQLLPLDPNQQRQVFGQGWHCLQEDGTPFAANMCPVQLAIRQRQPVNNITLGIVTPEQGVRWLLISVEPQPDAGGNVQRLLCKLTDITEQKNNERSLIQAAKLEHALAQITWQMRQSLDLEQILLSTTGELRQILSCDRVLTYRFNPDWTGLVVAESVAAGWQPLLPEVNLEATVRSRVKECVSNERCVVRDLDSAEEMVDTYLQDLQGGQYRERRYVRAVPDVDAAGFSSCYLELLRSVQARAYIIVPIFEGQQLWGLLCAYQSSGPRQWQSAEAQLIQQIARQLGLAIQQANLFEQTQQQADELRRAKEAAVLANRAKSDFLASMSHELRTPLNAVLGFAQVLLQASNLNAEQADFLRIINRSGEHLLTLINDVLEMSKIEAGRTKLQITDCDLPALVASLDDLFRIKAEQKSLKLQFLLATDLPQLHRLDQGKLRQVLINLLGNALKFTETGCVRLTVGYSLDAMSPTPRLEFRVEDTGPGIPVNELELVFQPFTQTQAGLQSNEGTGLGLSICQTYVQLMGGQVTVSNRAQGGACFEFWLPTQPLTTESATVAVHTQVDRLHLAPGQPVRRVLVIEDVDTSRLLLVQVLQQAGFEVDIAADGPAGLERCYHCRPDLILMDIKLPGLSGYDTLLHLQERYGQLTPPVIAVTAYSFLEQQETMLRAGFMAVVTKPVNQGDLLRAIARQLQLDLVLDFHQPASNPTLLEPNPSLAGQQQQFEQELSRVSIEWRQAVYQAAIACETSVLTELTTQMSGDFNLLRQRVRAMVYDFQFDALATLIKPE
ncbi:MAG: ATP-binding protein [Cyanobacteria bacterium P01_H01_bin.121]